MRPFTAFNFNVRIMLDDPELDPLCDAAFAECGGLEATTGVKTIREGGNNNSPIHLPGPVSYSQLSLKRGMTSSFDLWDWFDRVQRDDERHLRARCEVEMLAADGSTPQVRFVLTGCLPVKLKAPPLQAKDGEIAIEELEIAYELLTLHRPAPSAGAASA